jgi:hypothetical protein
LQSFSKDIIIADKGITVPFLAWKNNWAEVQEYLAKKHVSMGEIFKIALQTEEILDRERASRGINILDLLFDIL